MRMMGIVMMCIGAFGVFTEALLSGKPVEPVMGIIYGLLVIILYYVWRLDDRPQ